MLSQCSGADANSVSRSWGPLCNCGRATTIVKAWTNENPGRRFFRCGVHGFFDWADQEKPYGWQKVSLLEARDEIRQLKEEIKMLNESVKTKNDQAISASTNLESGLGNIYKQEKAKLESEVMGANEREKMLRQFIVLSWGCFIVVIAMILAMGK